MQVRNFNYITKEIKKIRLSKNINLKNFSSQPYYPYMNYLRTLQGEVEWFYSISIKQQLDKILTDERLTDSTKDLLYRHIKRYILAHYITFCINAPDIEFYWLHKNEPVFDNFKNDRILSLYTYINSVPELKKAFIPKKRKPPQIKMH